MRSAITDRLPPHGRAISRHLPLTTYICCAGAARAQCNNWTRHGGVWRLGSEPPVNGGVHAGADGSFPSLRCVRQARASTLNSTAIFSQLPCLGVWWNSSRLAMRRASPRPSDAAARDIGVGLIHQQRSPAWAPGYRHWRQPRRGSPEQVARHLLVFVVLTPRPPRLCRQRFPHVASNSTRQSRPPASADRRAIGVGSSTSSMAPSRHLPATDAT